VEHALQWCQVPGGEYYIQFGMGWYLVPAEDRHRLMKAALLSDFSVRIVCFAAPDRVREAVFFDQATAAYQERYPGIDDPDTWREGLAEMTAFLEDLAGFLDYGLVRRHRIRHHSWSEIIDAKWPERQNLRKRTLRQARGASSFAVPDVYGVMVLGPAHQWSPPPENWTVTPAANGRRLLRYNDEAALFSSIHPDEDTVSRMRRDLEPLLMTDHMASGNWYT
jgi:hypothetical protein